MYKISKKKLSNNSINQNKFLKKNSNLRKFLIINSEKKEKAVEKLKDRIKI